jgi:Domain of unknown function (DUF5605)
MIDALEPGFTYLCCEGRATSQSLLSRASVTDQYDLHFLDCHQAALAEFELPADVKFQAGVIDLWNMTVTRLDGAHQGKSRLRLPSKPCPAVRFRRVG